MRLRKLLPKITLKFIGKGKLWLGIFRKLVYDDDIEITAEEYYNNDEIPQYPLILNLRKIPSSVNNTIKTYTSGRTFTYQEFIDFFGANAFESIPESFERWNGKLYLIDKEIVRNNMTDNISAPNSSNNFDGNSNSQYQEGVEEKYEMGQQFIYHDQGGMCAYLNYWFGARMKVISKEELLIQYVPFNINMEQEEQPDDPDEPEIIDEPENAGELFVDNARLLSYIYYELYEYNHPNEEVLEEEIPEGVASSNILDNIGIIVLDDNYVLGELEEYEYDESEYDNVRFALTNKQINCSYIGNPVVFVNDVEKQFYVFQDMSDYNKYYFVTPVFMPTNAEEEEEEPEEEEEQTTP